MSFVDEDSFVGSYLYWTAHWTLTYRTHPLENLAVTH
jgi:hypothetical protein